MADRTLAGAQLHRVEVVVSARVLQLVEHGQRQRARAQVESRDRRAIVCRLEDAVRARIQNRRRHGERRERPVGVVQLHELRDAPPDEAGVHADVWHQFVLHPGGRFARVGVVQAGRIEDGAANAAARRGQLTLLALIPHPVAVLVGPVVAVVPVDRVVVDVLGDHRGAGIPPVRRVVALEHRVARARQIVGEPEARRGQVPCEEVVVGGKRHLRCGVEGAGRRTDLRRQIRAVAVESQAKAQRQLAGRAPRIGDVEAQRAKTVEGIDGRLEKQHFGRHAVA